MKFRTIGIISLGVLALAGCQTTTTYQKIGNGPPLEYAEARCELGSMSVEQGVFAYGSPGYVLGAQLGNAIGNEIRKQEFVKRCMVLQGWRAISAADARKMAPPPVPQQQTARYSRPRPTSRDPRYGTGTLPTGGLVASQ